MKEWWNPLYDLWRASAPDAKASRRKAEDEDEMYLFDVLRSGSFNVSTFMSSRLARDAGIEQYAFAVPTKKAMKQIVKVAPRIVELGAGTGYWAKLLQHVGADVVAIDRVPSGGRSTFKQVVGRWFPVRQGTVADLAAHGDRALMLNWPPYADPMAVEAVRQWGGQTVIYVGEGDGGCTADNAFHELMDAEFSCDQVIAIPQWFGIHDTVQVFTRTASGGRALHLEDGGL